VFVHTWCCQPFLYEGRTAVCTSKFTHGVGMNSLFRPKSNCMHAVHEVSSKTPVSFPKRIDLLIQAVWLHARKFGVKSCLCENPEGILLLTSIDAGSGSILLCDFGTAFCSCQLYYCETRDVYFIYSLNIYQN